MPQIARSLALAWGLPLALPMVVGACASGSNGGYPSLARRDAERITARADVVPGEASATIQPLPSDDLQTRIARLVADAKESDAAFRSRLPAARRLVAGGRSTSDSERWTVAQLALADLVAARSRGTVALAELDRLYAEERLAHAEGVSPAAEAIGVARDQIAAWVDEQDAAISMLEGN